VKWIDTVILTNNLRDLCGQAICVYMSAIPFKSINLAPTNTSTMFQVNSYGFHYAMFHSGLDLYFLAN
jgi:hypothetical protein